MRNDRSRCAPQARITRSMSERLWRRAHPAGAAGGRGWCSSTVSRSAATGWPIAAQSGRSSSRARTRAWRSAASRDGVVQFGEPGPAEQGPQGRVAERGPVELDEMLVAAGAIGQQRDRRHRRATGRLFAPSARGRRLRPFHETPFNFFPRGLSGALWSFRANAVISRGLSPGSVNGRAMARKMQQFQGNEMTHGPAERRRLCDLHHGTAGPGPR